MLKRMARRLPTQTDDTIGSNVIRVCKELGGWFGLQAIFVDSQAAYMNTTDSRPVFVVVKDLHEAAKTIVNAHTNAPTATLKYLLRS